MIVYAVRYSNRRREAHLGAKKIEFEVLVQVVWRCLKYECTASSYAQGVVLDWASLNLSSTHGPHGTHD